MGLVWFSMLIVNMNPYTWPEDYWCRVYDDEGDYLPEDPACLRKVQAFRALLYLSLALAFIVWYVVSVVSGSSLHVC